MFNPFNVLSHFWGSQPPEPVKTLKEIAQAASNGEFGIHQAVKIMSKGGIGAKSLMYICAPLKSDGEPELRASYQLIFNLAKGIKIFGDEGKVKLLIPAFSVREGEGFDPEVAASTAIEEAKKRIDITENKKDLLICFVLSEVDERNINAYSQAYQKQIINTSYPFSTNIRLIKGCIETLEADYMVIPMNERFEGGAIAAAAEKAALIPISEKKISEEIEVYIKPGEDVFSNVIPDIILNIFSRLNSDDLQSLALVCKKFNQTHEAPDLWKLQAAIANMKGVQNKADYYQQHLMKTAALLSENYLKVKDIKLGYVRNLGSDIKNMQKALEAYSKDNNLNAEIQAIIKETRDDDGPFLPIPIKEIFKEAIKTKKSYKGNLLDCYQWIKEAEKPNEAVFIPLLEDTFAFIRKLKLD